MKGFLFAVILAVGAVCIASEPAQAQCRNGSCGYGSSGYVYGQPVRNVGRYVVQQQPVRTFTYRVGNYFIERQPVRSTVQRVWQWRPVARVRSCVGGSCRR